jgi:tetratricopeptide (TPR) repeat protein
MFHVRVILWLVILSGTFSSCQNSGEASSDDKTVLNESSGDPTIDRISAEIDKQPGDASLYYERGQVYMDRKIYSEAIRDFTLAMELQPEQSAYYEALADAYLMNNMSFDALEVMKDAYKAFPDSVQVGLKLAKYHLILEQYLAAMNLTNKIIEQKPGLGDAYLFKGMVYRDMDAPLKAMDALQTAVELDAGLTDAWIIMGEMMAQEDFDMARRFYENAERSDPKALLPVHAHALFLHQNEQWAAAIEKYREAHQKDPSAAEPFYNAGLLYLELDSLNQASRMFDIAIGNDPTYAKAYYYRGMAAEWQKDTVQALADYRQAQQIDESINALSSRMQALQPTDAVD